LSSAAADQLAFNAVSKARTRMTPLCEVDRKASWQGQTDANVPFRTWCSFKAEAGWNWKANLEIKAAVAA